MSQHVLKKVYKGCRIDLEFNNDASGQLRINSITRESSQNTNQNICILRLGSTVQTDYEWHEFIEGIIRFSKDSIEAKLMANNTELISGVYPRLFR